MDEEADAWFDRELAGCNLADERLNKRLRKLVAQIGSAMGESIPLVCRDWANTKAAYRFFSNDRISEADILAGHFQSTRERTIATDGSILVLHDTTRVQLSKRELRRDRDHQEHKQRARQGGPPEVAHGLRHPDALEPGGDNRRAAAWTGGGQILDPEEVQGDCRA